MDILGIIFFSLMFVTSIDGLATEEGNIATKEIAKQLTIDAVTKLVTKRLLHKSNRQEINEQTISSVVLKILEEQKQLYGVTNVIIETSIGTHPLKVEKGERGIFIKGERGRIGLPGLTGLKGKQGERGYVGPSGESGENGRPGLNGLKGSRGPKGEAGEKGEAGRDGKDGAPGAGIGVPGQNGPEWKQGERGEQGEPGIDGKDGRPGKNGERGEKGTQGVFGKKGVTGPRGPKGEKGDSLIGPKGNKGPPGPPSVFPIHARMEKVQVKDGKPGINGQPGVNGRKGEPGASGEPGEMGPRGPKGPPGMPGIGIGGEKGEKGAPGKHGKDGSRGYAGDQGPRGLSGVKGEKGEGGKSDHDNLKAHILQTSNDLQLMKDMFSPGAFVLVSSTNELYVLSLFGWLQVVTGTYTPASSNSLAGGPMYHDQRREKERVPTPGMIDRRLMDAHLVLPVSGLFIPRPYLLLMALNEPLSGKMGGTAGADYLCYRQARATKLKGKLFRAFLSDRNRDISGLLDEENSKLPVVNFRGERIFESYTSIFNTSGYAAFNPKIPIYSFNNMDVRHDEKWPIKKIWHGSHAHGEHHFGKKSCSNWRTNVAAKTASASSLITYTPALNEGSARCNRKLIVLCIQTSLR